MALSALALAALLGVSCSADADGGAQRGTLHVVISGLTPGFVSAGSAVVTGTGLSGPLVINLPAISEAEADIAVGTYDVVYTPPVGYALAPGNSSSRNIEILKGETTDVEFTVVAASGTIRIVVTGLGGAVANGGTADILRTDLAGQTPFGVIVPIAGTADASVVPGDYEITYTPPGGYGLSEGEVNPRDVTVAADAMATATFAVEPLAAPAGVIFHSDWSTATGATAAAFRDTDKTKPWGFYCCDSNTNTSISTAASLSLTAWPTTNVYRVGTQASSPSAILTHSIEVDLGVPAPGVSRYFRYYLQVTHGDAHGNGTVGNIEHGVETAESGGGDGMNFYRIPRSDGTWFPAYREISTGVRYVGTSLNLLKNHTYRLEWGLTYGASTYSVQVRIYNNAGVLVATEADFHRFLPSEDVNIKLGTEAFTYTGAHHRFFRVGTNGPTSNFPMTNLVDQNLFLHGAVAVCEGDWCGPYADGK
jgi:hypothetical protein